MHLDALDSLVCGFGRQTRSPTTCCYCQTSGTILAGTLSISSQWCNTSRCHAAKCPHASTTGAFILRGLKSSQQKVSHRTLQRLRQLRSWRACINCINPCWPDVETVSVHDLWQVFYAFRFVFLNIPGLCLALDQYPLMFQATCHSGGAISLILHILEAVILTEVPWNPLQPGGRIFAYLESQEGDKQGNKGSALDVCHWISSKHI